MLTKQGCFIEQSVHGATAGWYLFVTAILETCMHECMLQTYMPNFHGIDSTDISAPHELVLRTIDHNT